MDPGSRVIALEQKVWTVCNHRFSRISAHSASSIFSSSGAADGASPYLSGYEGSACTDHPHPPGLESMLGRIADALEKPR